MPLKTDAGARDIPILPALRRHAKRASETRSFCGIDGRGSFGYVVYVREDQFEMAASALAL